MTAGELRAALAMVPTDTPIMVRVCVSTLADGSEMPEDVELRVESAEDFRSWERSMLLIASNDQTITVDLADGTVST